MNNLCRKCKNLEIDYEYDSESEDEYEIYNCALHQSEINTEMNCSSFDQEDYKWNEKDTECDTCEFNNSCELIDITTINDTRKHLTKAINTVCKRG